MNRFLTGNLSASFDDWTPSHEYAHHRTENVSDLDPSDDHGFGPFLRPIGCRR